MRRWSKHPWAHSLSSARPAAAPGRRGPLRGGGHGHVVFQLRVFNEILAWLSLDLNVSGFAPFDCPPRPSRCPTPVTLALLSPRLSLSTFTLAVSAGAVLLLPFSIISNEILLSFPQNYYVQWLNGSLIHGQCAARCGTRRVPSPRRASGRPVSRLSWWRVSPCNRPSEPWITPDQISLITPIPCWSWEAFLF